MRCFGDNLGKTMLVLLGIFPAAAQGQAVRPASETRDKGGPVKMEIYNGPNRTVHYFPGNVSAGDAASLRDLERWENELTLLDSLQALRRQYVDDERYLTTNRKVVQDILYGLSMNTSYSSYYAGSNSYGGISYPYYYGGGGIAGEASGLASTSGVSRSLAFGVGDEGRLKDALVQAIAAEASPEYAAGVVRSYYGALGRVGQSERLRAVAGLREDGRVAPVGFDQTGPATLSLKSGEKLEGKVVREDADWIVVQTPKEEITLRKSEVNRITKPSAPARP